MQKIFDESNEKGQNSTKKVDLKLKSLKRNREIEFLFQNDEYKE